MTDNDYIRVLKQYYGYDTFRSIQLDIIRSIGSGHDTLGLMPTGGGKSITFQVPALAMKGVCIVVTPLVALMKDQVSNLKKKHITAEYIYSGQSHQETQRVLDNAIYGAIKFLYVSPERLSNKLFLAKLYYMNVCFITVDEAHCISQWGYDFRPSYLQIGTIRELLPKVPVLALTATATKDVLEDIKEKLAFGKYSDLEPNVFRMSFKRDNLSYVVRHTSDKFKEMMHILNSVGGSAIIYTRNRQRTKETAKAIEEEGISATYYHAGLDFAIKDKRQADWQNDKTRVMVATNAFGMGIDKPDVRIVIHLDPPDSVEAYFQEAGRAGRDGKRAYAVLLTEKGESGKLLHTLSASFPPKEYIKRVYEDLAFFFELALDSGEGARYEFGIESFCMKFKHFPTHVIGALKILQNAEYLEYDAEPEARPRVQFLQTREALYNISDMSHAENVVLDSLLRSYGTLFVDLTYIDDDVVAKHSKMDTAQFHQVCKQLAHRGVIRYVPKRDIPLITYTRQRVHTDRMVIKRSVYEDLQEKMAKRIEAMINYISSTDTCRQQLLLQYFDEQSEPCHHCDICLQDKSDVEVEEKAKEAIMTLLSDGKEHQYSELNTLPHPRKHLHEAIEKMMKDNTFIITDTTIALRTK